MTLAGPQFDAYLRKLDAWEGRYPWMYLDIPGNVTTGVGHLIPSPEAAAILGFTGGDPVAAWHVVKAARPGMTAATYQSLTTCRLPDAAIDSLKHSDVATTYAQFAAAVPDSEHWPTAVKIACLDMSFNLGTSRFQREYFSPGCHFGPACARRDWTTAAFHSARQGIQPSRNEYIAALIRSAALTSLSPAA